jgi:hypothetical protein
MGSVISNEIVLSEVAMILAKIIFGAARSTPNVNHAHLAESYLGSLLRNGQISEYLLSSARPITAVVELPRPDAIDAKHLSQWGRKELRKVRLAFGRNPSTSPIGRTRRRRWPYWKSADSLYLFTHAFDRQSPVCAFNSTEPLPLYTLPISDRLREEVHSWADSYRDLDRVWLASGTLEMAAYRELADPSSLLSKTGRDLCAKIGRATRRRTYYFMHRYYGRRRNEGDRRCPGCGGDWRANQHQPTTTEFARFEFCCHRCKLVSHVAPSFGSSRQAAIGEFAGK